MAVVLAAMTVVACDGGSDVPVRGPGPVEYGTRDSAGVVVTENHRPPDGSRLGWTTSPAPVVSVGTQEGEAEGQLYRVRNATKLPDGRIVVANSGSQELLVFDSNGDRVAAWGGLGEGPGEFEALGRVAAWRGDSIIASDTYQFRVSVFDANGVHGRTTALPGAVGGFMNRVLGAMADQGPSHVMLAPVSDSLLLTWNSPIGMSGFQRQGHVFEVKRPAGDLLASLGEYQGPQTYTATVDQDNVMVFIPIRHPFGHTTEWAVWGDLVAFGRTEIYEVRAFRADGSLARIVRRDHEAGAPTRAELDARLEEVILQGRPDVREHLQTVVADVPMVETFPAFGRVLGDALGYLWVAEFRRPGDDPSRTAWTVFDSEGAAQGFVDTPGNLEVYEIGADYLLGRVRDELGTEYVQVWGLERSLPAPACDGLRCAADSDCGSRCMCEGATDDQPGVCRAR